MHGGTGEAGREARSPDAWAFGFLVAFVVAVYTVPAEWIAGMEALRPALVTSGMAAALMGLRRLARAEPLYLDGARGMALLAFVVIAAASAGWSVVPDISSTAAIEVVKLAAIYFTLVNVVTTGRRVVVACGAMVVASMVTSHGVIDWYNTGVDLVEGYRARWVGVYADPNHMAMDVGIVVPLAMAFFARKGSPWLWRAVCLVAAVMAVMAIVLSHSRGGFLGLCAAMAVWAALEKRKLQAVLVAVLFVGGLLLFAPESFWARNETVATFEEDASAMGRVYAWEVAAAIAKDRPLLGVGLAAFRFAWPLYAPPEATTAFVAHNIFLDVLGEMGWVGLFCFLIFSGGAAGAAFAGAKDPEIGWLSRGLAAAVVGYLVCDLFSGYIISHHYYVLFGLAACAQRIARAREASGLVPAHTAPGRGGALAWEASNNAA